MSRTHESVPISEFLTVGEAAAMLGVTAGTMRNWDRAGKLKPVRHPLNGYRLYKRSDLESLLHQFSGGQSLPSDREAV